MKKYIVYFKVNGINDGLEITAKDTNDAKLECVKLANWYGLYNIAILNVYPN